MRYVFRNTIGTLIEVKAWSEKLARRKAMIELWGDAPDKVIPHAPLYAGAGLVLVSKERK